MLNPINQTDDTHIHIDDTLYFPTQEELDKECAELAQKRGFTLEELLLCLDNSLYRVQEQKKYVENLRKEKKSKHSAQ